MLGLGNCHCCFQCAAPPPHTLTSNWQLSLLLFLWCHTPTPNQDPESETARKKAEADRLRAAEKFMVIGSGTAQCKGCGYEYSPEKGDPDFPIAKGVRFQVGVLWVWWVCVSAHWSRRRAAKPGRTVGIMVCVFQHAGRTAVQQSKHACVSSSASSSAASRRAENMRQQ